MIYKSLLKNFISEKHNKRLIQESLLDVRQKNAKNLSDEEFYALMSYDPLISELPSLDDDTMASANESYSRWLLKMKKLGGLQNESPEHVKKLLKIFDQAKKRRNLLPNNDIFSYKNVEELENAISQIDGNYTINQKNKNAKKAQKELKKELTPGMYLNGGAELLFINDNWEVWTPHTYEGSKALRRGACWCTGGDTDYYYNSYTQEGKLYIFIDKHNPEKKYQLFVPEVDGGHSKEFRDKNNESLKFREFANEDDELLHFLMSQEPITDNYVDLDDLSVDDEWDEERDDEVMSEYGLAYDDYTGEICMYIDYSDLVSDTYYTSYYDYKDMASHGYLEDGIQGDVDLYISNVIAEEYFIKDVDWEETDLKTLYEFFKKDSGHTEYSFNEFLETLFEGASHYNNSYNRKGDILDWFNSRDDHWESKVRNAISLYPLSRPYENFIYNALQQKGWDVPRDNNRFGGYSRSQSYMNDFKDYFKYTFDNCHTPQDFYEEYTNNGEKSMSNIIEDDIGTIIEEKGDIDTSECDWDEYSSEYAGEDAKSIVDIFMSIEEWNNFLSFVDETENIPEENGIRTTVKDNYYIFHDDGSLFYISKKEFERMYSYYLRWQEFNSFGIVSAIVIEQIAKYPTSYIKKILIKYSDLTDEQKSYLEKISDDEKINTDYIFDHLSSFIGNELFKFVKNAYEKNKKPIDESLFEPDW